MNRSEIFKLAWFFAKEHNFDMSEALKVAWRNHKLVKQMQEKIVRFKFYKVSGEIRNAVGTLMEGILPEVDASLRKSPEHCQVYFDMEAKAWRSFRKELLLAA
jgi:Ni,Fe-hydrogenase maturation factor